MCASILYASTIAGPALDALLHSHGIAEGGDDARGMHVEHSAVGHAGAGKWERNVEAVLRRTRDDVHVVVEDILPCRRAAVDDDVHSVRTGNLLHDRGQLQRYLEQVHGKIMRNVVEVFEVLSGHDQHVPRIHGLDIHECDDVGILVAHRDLCRTVHEVTEGADRLGALGHGSSRGKYAHGKCTRGATKGSRARAPTAAR